VVACGINPCWAETVQIKAILSPIIGYNPSSDTYEVNNHFAGYYSSDEIVAANNPFPNTVRASDPSVEGTYVLDTDYNQSMGTRFLQVVPILETMIWDSFSFTPPDALPPSDLWHWTGGGYTSPPQVTITLSVQRPFFSMVDKELLNGMTQWSWDGSMASTPFSPILALQPLPTSGLPYTPPPYNGTYNQAEQRFYVSDGRQYQVVPEPSSLSLLLACGAVLMAGRRRIRG